jgi:serpin B
MSSSCFLLSASRCLLPASLQPIPAMTQRLVFALPIALVLAACSEVTTAPKQIDQLPRPLTNMEQRLATSSTQFGLSLLRNVNERSGPDSNVFISPLSASMALGMTLTGAAGGTLDSMRATLGFPGMEIADIDASYRSLIDLLRGLDASVDFRIANSIWYDHELPVEQPFLDAGATYFDAKIAPLDFSAPGAASVINSWVNEGTNGKIKSIVATIPPWMVMYLINAIYFKGSWSYQFDAGKTSDQPFHAADGSSETIPMMYQKGTFPAVATADYNAVELPYGGGAYSMVVVVPHEGADVDSFISSLTPESWATLLASLTDQSGDVYLPRFRLEWQDSLRGDLTAMGMGIAFDGGAADFSGISRDVHLALTSVDQKTFVAVDEEGTEAAAVTIVGAGVVSLPPALIRADRPFLFAIRERLSGTLLFIGKIAEPPT